MTLTMSNIVLHQWVMSPFCNKVRRCLEFKGLSYQVVNYNGLRALDAAKLSPAGKLPVLDYDGQRLQDSARIARFLDQKHPEQPLYPAEPEALALSRVLEDWASQSLYFHELYLRMLDPVALEKALDLVCAGRPGWERPIVKFVLKSRYPKKVAQQGLGKYTRSEAVEQLMYLVQSLDAMLASQPFLTGAAMSIGDISVVAQLDEILRTSDVAERILGYARVRAWHERCGGRNG
jgi:glutathione S-transferase